MKHLYENNYAEAVIQLKNDKRSNILKAELFAKNLTINMKEMFTKVNMNNFFLELFHNDECNLIFELIKIVIRFKIGFFFMEFDRLYDVYKTIENYETIKCECGLKENEYFEVLNDLRYHLINNKFEYLFQLNNKTNKLWINELEESLTNDIIRNAVQSYITNDVDFNTLEHKMSPYKVSDDIKLYIKKLEIIHYYNELRKYDVIMTKSHLVTHWTSQWKNLINELKQKKKAKDVEELYNLYYNLPEWHLTREQNEGFCVQHGKYILNKDDLVEKTCFKLEGDIEFGVYKIHDKKLQTLNEFYFKKYQVEFEQSIDDYHSCYIKFDNLYLCVKNGKLIEENNRGINCEWRLRPLYGYDLNNI